MSHDPYGLALHTERPLKLLVVNCGSSSLKYTLFDTGDEARGARGQIERIGDGGMLHTHRQAGQDCRRELPAGGHHQAFEAMVESLSAGPAAVLRTPDEVWAVGHRVAHGGAHFARPALVDDEVIAAIESLSPLAPLHNPVHALGIREARRAFPRAPHVAVFDTSFHHTLPVEARIYGLPYEQFQAHGIRRYGFHGTSHHYVGLKAAEFLGRPFERLKLISCHLGNGSSLCAMDGGRSVDTSMGLTPLEGPIMGTRSGSLDPGILIHLMRTQGLGADELDRLLNVQGGLKGLSGISNDLREIEQAAAEGHARARLALDCFGHQLRKYIGAYVAVLGGLDGLVFTAGIGQGSAVVRSLACRNLAALGIVLDEARNAALGYAEAIHDLTAASSAARVLVVPTDEQRMIARETLACCRMDEDRRKNCG